ncbi:hypothetical protein EI171_23655 [Bradyrhizobium sp. LCT2]|uniref:hypothetical protein n=1 Tax=Bradyrhizobium sp. LCT2 TaxID=2493093 RepID=UPI001373BC46|nr:hypothetical protein [Bradyrhizobium sp. LCT2]QHP70026.1 hypothetical protein EI171_23655 [Bradyrhizobium sp. LCT2]
MTTAPPLYEEYEVLERLNLKGYELESLLNVGIIAPVAGGPSGAPRYCAETIDHLAAPEQRTRLADALWWDFDLQRTSNIPPHAPWARAVDLPFYPFDDEEQQSWARRFYKLKKACAPFPYPYPERLARYRSRMEDKATKTFERKHCIKRPRTTKNRKISVGRRHLRRDMSRAEIRDLVWTKTMIRAAADLGISEFALRHLCKRLRIPIPTRGHFNHKDPKKRPPKPALPPLDSIERNTDPEPVR